MNCRVPDKGGSAVCRAKSGAAGEEAPAHPLPQSQKPGVQPETAGAAAAFGCTAAQQERTEQHRESKRSQHEEHLHDSYLVFLFVDTCSS